jgi:uncharacterized protein YcbX
MCSWIRAAFAPTSSWRPRQGSRGFVEDGWLEGSLEVGDRVKIVQMRPTMRCVMTTHQQADLARDLRILRTAAQHHYNQVGVWASVGAAGTVRVGDPVVLVR